MTNEGPLLLTDYASQVRDTDVLSSTDFNPILQGLYGEVGGIMATAKKHVREKSAYPGFRKAAEEEFGDTLWYMAAICRRIDVSLEDVFSAAANHNDFKNVAATSGLSNGALAYIVMPVISSQSLDDTLVCLGQATAALLGNKPTFDNMVTFARAYLQSIHASELNFSNVARRNIQKVRGCFLEPQKGDLIHLDFDKEFKDEEQLPREFKILVNQRGSGKSYLQWNGVFIGDPLTDNISDRDEYRFHDVFHFSYVAILHWSPVIRALIKHKRKSQPKYDEEQDSGRAIVVEEGLTAWIFSKAKELNYFENQDKVSLGILKTIEEFVSGYEVEKCPLKLWEKAILDGYSVFRELRKNQGGWIIGNREHRTLEYRPFES